MVFIIDQLKVTSNPILKETIIKPNTVNNQYIDLSDTTKVLKPNDKDFIGQNKPDSNLDFNHQSFSARTLKLLMNADPASEIIKRLIFNNGAFLNPIIRPNNQSMIEQFMSGFFLNGEQLLEGIQSQCQGKTVFTGQFFDLLRNLYQSNNNHPQVENSILDLLKAFDLFASRQQTINYLNHNLNHLLPFLNQQDAQDIMSYIQALNQQALHPDGDLNQLLSIRKGILTILGSIASENKENNQLRNMIMLTIHNLSRLDHCDQKSVFESLEKLFLNLQQYHKISSSQRNLLQQSLTQQINQLQQNGQSSVNQIITALDQGLDDKSPLPLQMVTSNILSTLLLNQSILLPLIYCFVPLKFDDTYLFSELWMQVNEEAKQQSKKNNSTQAIKLFFSLESSHLGYFQGTIQLNDTVLNIDIEAPDLAIPFLNGLSNHLNELLKSTELKLQSCNIHQMTTPKKFYDIFGKNILKEAYINVRV